MSISGDICAGKARTWSGCVCSSVNDAAQNIHDFRSTSHKANTIDPFTYRVVMTSRTPGDERHTRYGTKASLR